MKEETRKLLSPLLDSLRGYSRLQEVRDCEFFLDGRDFVHFHETNDGVIADVLLSRGRVSMAVTGEREQAELLERIASRLESLEAHGRRRGKRKRERRRGPDGS